MNLKLLLAYEGTHYLGWQKTPFGKSIEECLEKAFFQILQEPLVFQAASRTDKGVHAEAQVVNCILSKPRDLFRLIKSVNAVLPKDITILQMEEAPEDFHPTLNAVGKEYHYHVCMGPTQLPFHRPFSWHVAKTPAIEAMQEAGAALLGIHDFSSFCNDQAHKNPECNLTRLELTPVPGNRLKFVVSGNHFLYKMVRNIVGTLVDIGTKKLMAPIPDILNSKDRTQAGITAPAHGLILKKVFYDL